MGKKKFLFIVNPVSGKKSKKGLENLIETYVDNANIHYEINYTDFPAHADKIVQEKINDFDVFVAVGGDGTINEIARSLSTESSPLGIIPMGSGNGLARHLKIPLNTKKALVSLNKSIPKALDTASINNHFFMSIAGVGFDSLIASSFAKAKRRGFLSYAELTIKEFFKYKEQNYILNLDGEKLERKAFMISFANSNQFGYNVKISPNADLEDALLDVCIVRKPTVINIPKMLWQLWNGKAYQSKYIEIIKAKNIKVYQKDQEYANVDGESIKVGHDISIAIHAGNLTVLTPSTK